MTLALAILTVAVALSFGIGMYFRVAEYDVLAADRVWDRIAPIARRIVDDERIPDEIAGDVAAFSILTGCGCFTRALLIEATKRKFGLKAPAPDNLFQKQVGALDGDTRHALFNLMRDLVMFDTLHSPLLGRLCRAVHRKHFARSEYRLDESVNAEREEVAIAHIAQTAEAVIARRPPVERVPELALCN